MELIVNIILIVTSLIISGAFLAFTYLLFKDAFKKHQNPPTRKRPLFPQETTSKTPMPEFENT